MVRIRAKNTKNETIVVSYLRKKVYLLNYYLRAAGNSDIALLRKKKVVFKDGDFGNAINLSDTEPSGFLSDFPIPQA